MSPFIVPYPGMYENWIPGIKQTERIEKKIAEKYHADFLTLQDMILSYATLMKKNDKDWQKENFLSLAGVYAVRLSGASKVPSVLQSCLVEDEKIKTVYLHLDNDRAGRIATSGIEESLKDHVEVIDEPPPYGKDFNDYLCKVNVEEMKRKRERKGYYER